MRCLRFIPLSLCLLLAACGGDELVLHFDTPISAEQGGIDPALRESLEQALAEQQFTAEQVDFKLLDGDQSVRVSFAGEPLTAERRQALQDYFAARLDARKQWSGELSLEIQPERLDESLENSVGGFLAAEEREKLREKVNGMRKRFDTRLAFSGDVELVYELSEEGSPLATGSDQALCQVSADLEKPLPELEYHVQHNDAIGGSFFSMLSRVAPIVLPHHIDFADDELQNSVDDGALAYTLRPKRWADDQDERLLRMTFEFGSVGTVDHTNGMVFGSLEGYESECLDRVTKAGRPFTYFYGKTLDRLQAVEYRFQDES